MPKLLSWALIKRLEFIDCRLMEWGTVNRQLLMLEFKISTAQASKDLRLYRELAPKNMFYNFKSKNWLAYIEVEPLFKDK